MVPDRKRFQFPMARSGTPLGTGYSIKSGGVQAHGGLLKFLSPHHAAQRAQVAMGNQVSHNPALSRQNTIQPMLARGNSQALYAMQQRNRTLQNQRPSAPGLPTAGRLPVQPMMVQHLPAYGRTGQPIPNKNMPGIYVRSNDFPKAILIQENSSHLRQGIQPIVPFLPSLSS